MSPVYRSILKLARVTHLYLTLFGLVLILLFAVTGFMLNHIDPFVTDDPQGHDDAPRKLSPAKFPNQQFPKLDGTSELTGDDKLALVETLRKECSVRGELTSLQVMNEGEDEKAKQSIKLEFRRAGEIVLVVVESDGTAKVCHKFKGWTGVLTDLHRGNRGNGPEEPKFTGMVWSLVIDGTAIILVMISLTGLVLWSSLKTRGKSGAILLLLGGTLTFVVYYWFTP